MNTTMFNRDRPLSWSAISSFQYDPEQWYRRYVLNERDEGSPEMRFGKEVGDKLATDPTYLPAVPRAQNFEYALEGEVRGVKLIGYADSWEPFVLREYKTGVRPWTQKRVDTHGQIDMYLLLLWLMHKHKPEETDVSLTWLPTERTGDFRIQLVTPTVPVVIPTHRSMQQILTFAASIQHVISKMQEYLDKHECN